MEVILKCLLARWILRRGRKGKGTKKENEVKIHYFAINCKIYNAIFISILTKMAEQ